MSATGRGSTRLKYDSYYTPGWCVDLILKEIENRYQISHRLAANGQRRWIEPAVGGGDIIKAVNKSEFPDVRWTTVDINPEVDAMIEGDGVSALVNGTWDVCISNPPYSLAFDFAKAAVSSCHWTIFLLRLNWLASAKRSTWIQKNTPAIFVIPNRPSFTPDGKTDSSDYAWMVWSTDILPCVHVLPSTPIQHRRK